jgi:hypothetical protein
MIKLFSLKSLLFKAKLSQFELDLRFTVHPDTYCIACVITSTVSAYLHLADKLLKSVADISAGQAVYACLFIWSSLFT